MDRAYYSSHFIVASSALKGVIVLTTFLLYGSASAQTVEQRQLSFLDGRGSITLPAGDMHRLENDSLVIGAVITSGIHRYYFRIYSVDTDLSTVEFLNSTSRRRQETASSDVTVNLDRIVCGIHAGVDLTHWMWHPTAKPQGLLLSKDRMFILENLLLYMTVEGNAAGIIEITADEFLNSVRYQDEAICMN